MKKSIKYVLLATLFFCGLCFEQIVIACGGGEDPYDYYYSFFHNNVAGSNAYMPFYFVTGYEYYEDWNYGGNKSKEEDDLNLKEWIDFGQKKFTDKDAADFIYRYNYDQLSNLYYHIEKGNALQLPDSVKRNGMTKWFLQDKDLEALGYLMFAKKCEAFAAPASEWDAPSKDLKGMGSAIKGGLQLWKAAKKDFFQWRYAYQVLRMAFYSDDYQRTFDLYKDLIGDKTSTSLIYYRCLSMKAGAHYKTGDYNTAAYLYSLAFNATDDNKAGNYISYDWCFRPHGESENGPRADRNKVLSLAKSNSEKAVIAVMDALHEYNDGLPLMKEAYQLDPKVKGLDVVMTREINKMEMNLLDPSLRRKSGFKNDFYPYNSYYSYAYHTAGNEESGKAQEQNKRELKELIVFGSKLSAENKAPDAAFWPLSVAYLYFIQEDWKNCEEWLGKVGQLHPEGKLKNMLEMEKLLLAINKNRRLDAATEAGILPSLQWLEQQAIRDNRFAITYRNLMISVLPNVYMRQQDTMKALLCIAKGTTGPQGKGIYSAWYAYEPDGGNKAVYVEPGSSVELEQITTAKVIAIKEWIKNATKTPYESFLVKYQPYQQGSLDQYIGTRYLRQLDFAKAVDILKKVPAEVLNQCRFPDPFAERWIDTQEPKDTTTISNKYLFAKEMLRLQEQADKGTDPEMIYRYANGLYSMTYYGLSWEAALYYRSGTDPLAYYSDSSRNNLLPEYRNYYSAEKAARFYQMAFEKATDKELKAKCLFMLSKCWQKNATIVNKNLYNPAANDEYYLYTLKSPYFKQLTENYAQTNIFKSLHEDCSYLRLYVRKAHKQ